MISSIGEIFRQSLVYLLSFFSMSLKFTFSWKVVGFIFIVLGLFITSSILKIHMVDIELKSAFPYILIIFIVGIILKIYLESESFQLNCIISEKDGKTQYCVREREKLELAKDLLETVNLKLMKLVKHCKNDKDINDRENIKRLVKGYNPTKIYEILPTSKYTAYSENKGEKLAFCVNTEKNNNKLIDENTLTFVAIHELSHIATKSIGHTKEFWDNFKMLLKISIDEVGILKPQDYRKKKARYCGMNINDNPYYDRT